VQQAGNAQSSEGISEGESQYTITLYRNGFMVNDGPLRDPEQPESQTFLSQLMEGVVPDEIIRSSGGRRHDLAVSLVDKRSEDYVPPPPPAYVAFSGTGSSLGVTANESAIIFTPDLLQSITIPILNESEPVATIQVRAHNGKRLKIRINASRSVLELAAIVQQETGNTTTNFTLSAGFPPQDLQNPNSTISDAKLSGAVVTQKAL
jgi:UBX domain-containing protein 1